ncbi:hypothetical protein CHCC20375_3669 [Bacillus licheniformis]|nr:hypothetical protein CHCC20375_3669 [Bacillus licheniformis]
MIKKTENCVKEKHKPKTKSLCTFVRFRIVQLLLVSMIHQTEALKAINITLYK